MPISSRSIPRTAAALGTTLLLAGCGTNSVWKDYFELLRGSMGQQGISRDQAAAIPYASIGIRVNGSNQAMLVLATDTNGDQLWTSAARIVLLTRNGRIARSVGLAHDLAAMSAPGTQALPPLLDALKAPYRSTRQMDLPDQGAYALPVTCNTLSRGRNLITILGTAMATVRIDEICRSTTLSWSFTNSYWLDADTGFVWRSVQNLHPAGVRVETEIFRPPE